MDRALPRGAVKDIIRAMFSSARSTRHRAAAIAFAALALPACGRANPDAIVPTPGAASEAGEQNEAGTDAMRDVDSGMPAAPRRPRGARLKRLPGGASRRPRRAAASSGAA